MIDRLESTLSDLRSHAIDIKEAQKRLDFLSWQEDDHQKIGDACRISKLVDTDIPLYGRSPEDTVIAQENAQEYRQLISDIRRQLTLPQRRVFYLGIIKGQTQVSIATRMNISQPAVSQALQAIMQVLTQYATEDVWDMLVKPVNLYGCRMSAEKVRWPFDFLASQKPCMVHEYLEKGVCCTWCPKCTNKNMNTQDSR